MFLMAWGEWLATFFLPQVMANLDCLYLRCIWWRVETVGIQMHVIVVQKEKRPTAVTTSRDNLALHWLYEQHISFAVGKMMAFLLPWPRNSYCACMGNWVEGCLRAWRWRWLWGSGWKFLVLPPSCHGGRVMMAGQAWWCWWGLPLPCTIFKYEVGSLLCPRWGFYFLPRSIWEGCLCGERGREAAAWVSGWLLVRFPNPQHNTRGAGNLTRWLFADIRWFKVGCRLLCPPHHGNFVVVSGSSLVSLMW